MYTTLIVIGHALITQGLTTSSSDVCPLLFLFLYLLKWKVQIPLKLNFGEKHYYTNNSISYEIPKRVNFIESNSGMVVVRGWGEENTKLLIQGHKLSVK